MRHDPTIYVLCFFIYCCGAVGGWCANNIHQEQGKEKAHEVQPIPVRDIDSVDLYCRVPVRIK